MERRTLLTLATLQNNHQDGYQSPPVNWRINADNKKQFFGLVKQVTGVQWR